MGTRRVASRQIIAPLWQCAVYVVVGATMADGLRAARRRWRGIALDTISAECEGAAVSLADDSAVVVVLPADATVGTVAHECAHAATRVLRRAGVRVCASEDEPLAYTIGHLVDEVVPWLARTRARLALRCGRDAAHP